MGWWNAMAFPLEKCFFKQQLLLVADFRAFCEKSSLKMKPLFVILWVTEGNTNPFGWMKRLLTNIKKRFKNSCLHFIIKNRDLSSCTNSTQIIIIDAMQIGRIELKWNTKVLNYYMKSMMTFGDFSRRSSTYGSWSRFPHEAEQKTHLLTEPEASLVASSR